MKKPIVIIAIMALTLLAWSFFSSAQTQEPAKEEKPTFYRLVPGTYVNGWPRFTVRYPKDWVEMRGRPFLDAFRAGVAGPPHYPDLGVIIVQNPRPLETSVNANLNAIRAVSTDVTVVSDKPSHLRDGTPARENEFQHVVNGVPFDTLCLSTKKGDTWVILTTSTPSGKTGEDLKAILYSIEFQPGKDDPVKVPPDIQEFLDSWRNAIVSHDLAKFMTHFSDKYLNSGVRKGEVERVWRMWIGGITLFQVVITDFIPAGDRAYLTGFVNFNLAKGQLIGTSIIKESGEWKWYGNQRDVTP